MIINSLPTFSIRNVAETFVILTVENEKTRDVFVSSWMTIDFESVNPNGSAEIHFLSFHTRTGNGLYNLDKVPTPDRYYNK